MKMRVASLLTLCLSCVTSVALASEVRIEEFTLDNGLHVIVLPNDRVPAISHMLWFPSGGADDPSGKSGLAHFHEHMMFKGSPNHPAGEFEATVARSGGDHNAFTSYDATGYYINIPKEALPTIIELEADRLRGITPSDDDAIKERQVIIEERRMRVENNPKALFAEQLNAALFVNHPYGTPLIGWQHEMEQLSKEDALTFHEDYYHASNATLILAGDVTADEAKPLVTRHYGKLSSHEAPKRHWNEEPPIRAEKRLNMEHAQVREPYWQRQYIAPSFGYGNTSQVIPLMVFSEWLGSGDTSYLYQELVVKQKIATSISASYSGFGIGPEKFVVSATPHKGVSVEKLEAAIDEALGKALAVTPSADDISRAKTLLKAQTLYAQEGLQGIAYIVGWLTILGLDADYINQWPDDVDAATIPQMQQAGRDALQLNGSVTGILLPSKNDAEVK